MLKETGWNEVDLNRKLARQKRMLANMVDSGK